ncbi:MAG: HD domain-containing protein [Lachnospiraceae bacterium]|nr:HD domain-containing protein [Lachnospiraceae bacterium]
MQPQQLLDILSQAAKLKTELRHCYTEGERRESVADHSWRIALMAMLLSGVDEYADLDMNKVIRMCLIHDLGETFTGDIPTFVKTDKDAGREDNLFLAWVQTFPRPQREEWLSLLAEMEAQESTEAKLYKSLDRLEALIAHNESDIATWLPLEYDLQFTYGQENIRFSPYLMALRKKIDAWSFRKIEAEGDETERKKLQERKYPEV